MKKVYRKPDILFENFELSANIAGTCQAKNDKLYTSDTGCLMWVTSTDFLTGSCELFDCEYEVFTDYNTCETISPNGDYNNLCYHVPSENLRAFTS